MLVVVAIAVSWSSFSEHAEECVVRRLRGRIAGLGGQPLLLIEYPTVPAGLADCIRDCLERELARAERYLFAILEIAKMETRQSLEVAAHEPGHIGAGPKRVARVEQEPDLRRIRFA